MISRLGSGGPWEDTIGYSRVVKAGPLVLTAGCTATVDGVVKHAGDAYAQTLLAFEIALEAAGQYGVTAEDVVRTRMYVVADRSGPQGEAARAGPVGVDNSDAVGRAHGAVFRDIRPVATMVFVDRLIHPDMLVEVEVEAYRA